jgi:hypothetical protein
MVDAGSYRLKVLQWPVLLWAAGIGMDDGELFSITGRNRYARRNVGKSLRGEKLERQVGDGLPEFRTDGAVPGVDFVEGRQRWTFCVLYNADQVDAGVGNGSGAVGEPDQGEGRARGPDFGVIGFCGFQSGER